MTTDRVLHLYRAREDVPELGVQAGDWLQVKADDGRAWLFRELGTFGNPIPSQCIPHFHAAGDAPPLWQALGLRRPPARKRASKPKLTLIEGGGA